MSLAVQEAEVRELFADFDVMAITFPHHNPRMQEKLVKSRLKSAEQVERAMVILSGRVSCGRTVILQLAKRPTLPPTVKRSLKARGPSTSPGALLKYRYKGLN